jgi:hypothetical protein
VSRPFVLTGHAQSAMLTAISGTTQKPLNKGGTMSTIATKFSSASAKAQLAVASVAVVAAATLTPAIAEAAPSIAPITQSVGNSFEEILYAPVVNSATPGDNAAAAVVTAGPIQNFITAIVQGVATLVYAGLTFIANSFAAVANFVARVFRVGPYSTSA